MQEKLLSQKNSIIIVVLILSLMVFGGYAFYNLKKELDSVDKTAGINVSLLTNKDLKEFYGMKDKIKIQEKDTAFLKKHFYEELVDHTVEIPTIDPTGRPNPFWMP
ncbi:MAG: hypothetical protein KBC41_03290 [Candidatus Pacebacteria bacterium]|nr:hypothetical protein [Candidatus Paceibacterota bacterium]MBP9867072.1 hypothetical protein [Candidatus Paceibacterota bacterium]